MAPRDRDDRDQRKKLTPPAGVRAQTAGDPSWDENTPVTAQDPVSILEERAKRAAAASRDAAVHSQAAINSIELLRQELYHSRTEVQAYIERDQADHDRLFQQADKFGEKLDDISKTVSDLRVDVAERNTKVDTMIGILEEERRARAEHARLKLEAEVQVQVKERLATVEVDKHKAIATVEDQRETASFKRKRSLKLWHILSALISLGGTVLAATQC